MAISHIDGRPVQAVVTTAPLSESRIRSYPAPPPLATPTDLRPAEV